MIIFRLVSSYKAKKVFLIPLGNIKRSSYLLIRKLSLVYVLSLIARSAFAQQPQVYNQFFMNPYVYNPAYAGVEGHTTFFLMYRQQWIGIEDAPQISHASFHVPLNGGISVGVAAFNITQGLLTTSAGKISAGYLLNIDRTHFLRFGFSIGGGINSVNISKFDSPDDPAFDNFLDQNSFLIGDFGMTYHFGHFNVGFSIPNLFTYDVVTQTEFAPINVTPLDNVLFKINYRGHINDDLAFEPHLIYRYSNTVPHQYEGTLIAHIKHLVWVGASYREDSGIIGLTGAKIKEKIGIGFAYELGNPEISTELGPTFEVNIGYHLGTKKEHAEHVSSFIKSHRLSAEERAKKAELERQKQIAALQESREQLQQEAKDDDLGIVGGATTQVANDFDNAPSSNNANPDNPDRDTIDNSANDSNSTESQGSYQNDSPAYREERERGNPTLTQDFRTHEELGASNQPLIVKRGNHLLELPSGNFVIAGAFEVFDHAETYSDQLFEKGFHDTIVGYLSARGYYYVVVFQSNNIGRARARRDEMRQLPELSKAWVLQVTE